MKTVKLRLYRFIKRLKDFFVRLAGSIIGAIYFRYFFNQDKIVENFVLHFVPENMRGANPVFFVTFFVNKLDGSMWQAEVNMDYSGYKIRCVRKLVYK